MMGLSLPKAIVAIRPALTLAALLLCSSAMAALEPANEAARAHMNKGNAAYTAGKANAALAAWRESIKADPAASQPVSAIAHLFLSASLEAKSPERETYRKEAEQHARFALKLDERDPMAMEVLRQLDDPAPERAYQPSAEVLKAMDEGEVLFTARDYAGARKHYARAFAMDPKYAQAVLFVGDTYYAEGKLVDAEPYFRRATELAPGYALGWRFLFDAQMGQDKLKDAQVSVLGALAARPSEQQNWLRLARLYSVWGQPLTKFNMVKGVSVEGTTINLDQDLPAAENMAWLAYGLGLSTYDAKSEKGDKDAPNSPFLRELFAWDAAMEVLAQTKYKDKIKDPALLQMATFHKAGQLKPAILTLLYREAFRNDFEAWKKAEPDGIKRFIDTFHVGL